MKKLFLILMASVISVSAMTSCSIAPAPKETATSKPETIEAQSQQPLAVQNTQFIGEEKAKEIALNKAELSAEEVKFMNIRLDRDNGIWEYEVEFRKGMTEYDAEINAETGEIIAWEMDTDD